jgi:L-asparaginase II
MGTQLSLTGYRGQQPEIVHALEWVQCDANGQVLAGTTTAADPVKPFATWIRSCAKPFQVLACVPVDQLALHPAQALAVAAGSHSGELAHLPWVQYWLDQCPSAPSIEPPCLLCGQHPAVTGHSHTPANPLTHNCSGNHGVMVWASRQPDLFNLPHQLTPLSIRERDLPKEVGEGLLPSTSGRGCFEETGEGKQFDRYPKDYTHPQHPIQQRVLATLGHWLGQVIAPEQVGVDGCGVPTVYAPLQAMARAYARLISTPETAPLVAAMTSYPHLVAGQDRLDTALMQASQSTGQLLSKVGADGLVCVAHLGLKQAIALKACDGNQAARDRAIVGLLTRLGWLDPMVCQTDAWLADLLNPHRLNGLGQVIGQWVLGV